MQKVEIRDPAELVQAAMQPAPSAVFSLFRVGENGERYEYPLRVQLLRWEESIQAIQAAQKSAQERGEDPARYLDVYKEEQAAQIVARCLCKVEGPEERDDGTRFWRRLFVDPKHLRASFTEVETAYCLNMYEVVKAKYRAYEEFNVQEVDAWASRLSDELMGGHFLARLDSTHWPTVIYSLAQRVRDLSEELTRPLPDWRSSSESESTSSDSGTTGSTELPSASLKGRSDQIPTGHLLSSEEAQQIARGMASKVGQADGDGEPE